MTKDNKPTIHHFDGFFIGNPLSISDAVLNLANGEIGCLDFTRMAAVNELLFMSDERRASVRIVLVDEAMLDDLKTVISQLCTKFPHTHIAFAYRHPANARRLIECIPDTPELARVGFLPMNMDADRWLSVLRLLVCGERYLPSELISTTEPPQPQSQQQTPEPTAKPAPKTRATKGDGADDVRLTERELQVLRSVAEGKQNKIIANELNLSQHTVKLHLHHVISKLGVNNRTEAAIWFLGRTP